MPINEKDIIWDTPNPDEITWDETPSLIDKAGILAKQTYQSIGLGAGDVLTGTAASIENAPITPPPYMTLSEVEAWKKRSPEMVEAVKRGDRIGKNVVSENLYGLTKNYPELKEETPFGLVGQAVTGVARSAAPMVATAVNAPAGVAATVASIKGNKYNQYIKEGKDEKTANDAADLSALLTAPVEFAGNLIPIKSLTKLVEKSKVGATVGEYITEVLKSAAGEGLEELTQSQLDIIADQYANNPNADPVELGKNVAKQIWTIENAKQAGTSTLVGMIGGAGLTGVIGAPSMIPGKGEQAPTVTQRPDNADQILATIKEDFDAGNLTPEIIASLKQQLPELSNDIDKLTSQPDEVIELRDRIIEKEQEVGRKLTEDEVIELTDLTTATPAIESAQAIENELGRANQINQSTIGREGLRQKLLSQTEIPSATMMPEKIIQSETTMPNKEDMVIKDLTQDLITGSPNIDIKLNATMDKLMQEATKEPEVKAFKKGDIIQDANIRYDGEWPGVGHQWTDLTEGQESSFITKNPSEEEAKAEVINVRKRYQEETPAEAQAKKALNENEWLNLTEKEFNKLPMNVRNDMNAKYGLPIEIKTKRANEEREAYERDVAIRNKDLSPAKPSLSPEPAKVEKKPVLDEEPAKEGKPKEATETKDINKIAHTDKSVRDYPQRASYHTGVIRVENKSGNKRLGVFNVSMEEWDEAQKGPSANPNYNKRELVKKKHLKAFPGNIENGALTPIAKRVIDAQVRAIDNVYKSAKEQSTPDLKPKAEKEVTQIIDSLNPSGNIFADYTPEQRMNMKLGDNITTLDKTMEKSPNEEITIYRGATENQKEIVGGDFVTTNKQLAQDYAGTGKVIEKKVKLSDILDDKTEPLGEEYIYRPQPEEKSAGEEATTKSKPGKVYLDKGGVKPFFEYREIKRGNVLNKGKYRVTLTNGKTVTVNKEAIREFPSAQEDTGDKPVFLKEGDISIDSPTGKTLLTKQGVENIIKGVKTKLPNIGNFEVVKTQDELPESLFREQERDDSRIYGVYDPQSDTFYLVADNMKNRDAVLNTVIHEAIGHRGVDAILPKSRRKQLFRMVNFEYGKKDIGEKIIKDYKLDLTDETDQVTFAREVIAHMAVNEPKASLLDRVISMIKSALRELGITLKISDAEIRSLLARSYKFAQTGKGKAESEGLSYSKDAPDITDTKEFKEFFGDSKVVDEDGKPLVVYHGTGDSFDEFDFNKLGEKTGAGSAKNLGFFFSSSDVANDFTGYKNQSIMPVYLSIQNPKYISATEFQEMLFGENERNNYINSLKEDISDELNETLYDSMGHSGGLEYQDFETGNMYLIDEENLSAEAKEKYEKYQELLNVDYRDVNNSGFGYNPEDWEKLKTDAVNEGYDGIIIESNDYSGGEYNIDRAEELRSDNYIVFKPEQIKSIYNRGTFDKTDKRIMFSKEAKLSAEDYAKNLIARAGKKQETVEKKVVEKVKEPAKTKEPKTSNFGMSGMLSNNDKAKQALNKFADKAGYWILDKNLPIAKIQENLKKMTEELDLFLSETQRPKRTAAKIKQMWEDMVTPLLKTMGENQIDLGTLEEYKHAKHARERNEAMRKGNAKRYIEKVIAAAPKETKALQEEIKDLLWPEEWYAKIDSVFNEFRKIEAVKDIEKQWNTFIEKPSGMSDKDADKILAFYQKDKAKLAKIEEVGKIVDAINRETIETLYNSGQIADKEYEIYKTQYKNYVPLHREGFEDESQGTGRGLQPAGRLIKTAMGSTRDVVNILAHSITNLENAINRAEKAESAKILLNMVKENPDPDLWSLNKVKETPRHDEAGNLKMYPDSFSVAPNEMRFMVDGQQYLLSMNRNNDNAMRMLKTLKAEDSIGGPLVNALSKMNKWLARINTTWSPEFVITNFIKDIQAAGININDTGVESKRMFRGALSAIKSIHEVESGKGDGGEYGKYYTRFKDAGGKIGWSDIYGTAEKMSKELSKDIEMFSGKRPVRQVWQKTFKFIEDWNTSVENGVRLHAFKLAVDQGFSDKKAAQIASDLTVDFTKKGAAGPVINSLYLFANAGIQGSYRIFRAWAKSPKVKKIMGGIVGAGILNGLLNAAIGGQDDDGEDYYNKIDDYVKERNWIIMIPNSKGKYLKIPLPWGYNVLWNIGDEISKTITKEDYKPLHGAGRLMSVFAQAFNPIQSGTLLQTLSPTITDPFAMVAENKNWYGGDLMPQKNVFEKVPTPDSQRYWKTSRAASQWVAEKLNDWTGGNQVRKGGIDVSPETLDLIVDTMGGSAMRFFTDAAATPLKLIRGEETKVQDFPFIRRAVGEKSQYADQRTYYENLTQVLTAKEELDAYKGTSYYNSLDQELKDMKRMIPIAEGAEKRLRKLRKIRNRSDNKAQIDNINKQIEQIYVDFNKKYYNTVKGD